MVDQSGVDRRLEVGAAVRPSPPPDQPQGLPHDQDPVRRLRKFIFLGPELLYNSPFLSVSLSHFFIKLIFEI